MDTVVSFSYQNMAIPIKTGSVCIRFLIFHAVAQISSLHRAAGIKYRKVWSVRFFQWHTLISGCMFSSSVFDLLKISHISTKCQALVRQQLSPKRLAHQKKTVLSTTLPPRGALYFWLPKHAPKDKKLKKLGQLVSVDQYRAYLWGRDVGLSLNRLQ